MHRIRLEAPAKLNLFLEVLGKRSDGYHELATVMHAVDLTDTVTVRLETGRAPGAPAVVLQCTPPVTARPEDNLAYRAARVLLDEDPGCTVHVDLEKRIPAGAGLGGGSSDAAAVLRAVNRLTRGARTEAALQAAAVDLGADVPFFLTGGTAVCEGVGEKVTPLRGVAPMDFVLVIPEVKASTARVFRNLRLDLTLPGRSVRVFARSLTEGGWGVFSRVGSPEGPFNRLTETAMRLHPELEGMARSLESRTGLRFLVTGSGSGLFAACPGGGEACRRLAARVEGTPGVSRIHAVTSHEAGRDRKKEAK